MITHRRWVYYVEFPGWEHASRPAHTQVSTVPHIKRATERHSSLLRLLATSDQTDIIETICKLLTLLDQFAKSGS